MFTTNSPAVQLALARLSSVMLKCRVSPTFTSLPSTGAKRSMSGSTESTMKSKLAVVVPLAFAALTSRTFAPSVQLSVSISNGELKVVQAPPFSDASMLALPFTSKPMVVPGWKTVLLAGETSVMFGGEPASAFAMAQVQLALEIIQ